MFTNVLCVFALLSVLSVSVAWPVMPDGLYVDMEINNTLVDNYPGRVWSDLRQAKARTDVEYEGTQSTVDDFNINRTYVISVDGKCTSHPMPSVVRPLQIPPWFRRTGTEKVGDRTCDVFEGILDYPTKMWVTQDIPALILKNVIDADALLLTVTYSNHKIGPVDPSFFTVPEQC